MSNKKWKVGEKIVAFTEYHEVNTVQAVKAHCKFTGFLFTFCLL